MLNIPGSRSPPLAINTRQWPTSRARLTDLTFLAVAVMVHVAALWLPVHLAWRDAAPERVLDLRLTRLPPIAPQQESAAPARERIKPRAVIERATRPADALKAAEQAILPVPEQQPPAVRDSLTPSLTAEELLRRFNRIVTTSANAAPAHELGRPRHRPLPGWLPDAGEEATQADPARFTA